MSKRIIKISADDLRSIINNDAEVIKKYLSMLPNPKKCECCGHIFNPQRHTEIYCDNCKLTGYIKKVKSDDILKKYNTAYKTMYARMRRKKLTIEELAIWRERAYKAMLDAKAGHITMNEYTTILYRI